MMTENTRITFNVRHLTGELSAEDLHLAIEKYLWNMDGVDRVMSSNHEESGPCESDCPGLQCHYSWHIHGCEPYWAYNDADGYDVSGDPGCEETAAERVLWEGPDGPTRIEYRRGHRWEEA